LFPLAVTCASEKESLKEKGRPPSSYYLLTELTKPKAASGRRLPPNSRTAHPSPLALALAFPPPSPSSSSSQRLRVRGSLLRLSPWRNARYSGGRIVLTRHDEREECSESESACLAYVSIRQHLNTAYASMLFVRDECSSLRCDKTKRKTCMREINEVCA
jgi:hypothetical protein